MNDLIIIAITIAGVVGFICLCCLVAYIWFVNKVMEMEMKERGLK